MSCAGCEAEVPTILWVDPTAVANGYTPLPMTPTAGGGYSDPATVPKNFADPSKTRRVAPSFFMTTDGWDGYVTVALVGLDVAPSHGTCHESSGGGCEQLTSCAFELVCTWEVIWVSPGEAASPVAPTIQVGSGPAQAAAVVGPVVNGDRFGITGDIERWTSIDCQYVYTYEPQCDGSLSADFDTDDIIVGLAGFSAAPITPLGHIRLGFSCAACGSSTSAKPGGSGQDTGKNVNPASIGGGTLASLEDTSPDSSSSCTGCSAVGMEEGNVQPNGYWDPVAGYVVSEGTGFGGSDLSTGGDSSYDVSAITVTNVFEAPGECERSSSSGKCEVLYSCRYGFTVLLGGSIVSKDPNWKGPGFLHTPWTGWRVPGELAQVGVVGCLQQHGTQTGPDAGGYYTTPMEWLWDYEADPGCGSSFESYLQASQFGLDGNHFDTFTKIDVEPVEVIHLRMGCTECEEVKPPIRTGGPGGSPDSSSD